MLRQVAELASAHPALAGAVPAGIAVACLAFVLLGRRPRTARSLREKVEGKAGADQDADIDGMLNWLPRDGGADRRRSPRRAGPPTPIRVAASAEEGPDTPLDEALVLDRATGGLCFAIERLLPAGAEVFLRVEGAEPDFPWVPVSVRHCRDCGEFFLVGCRFREQLPLTILLQFG